jgi:protocatechuate 3,4-dioxygenase beta subunit
MNASPQRLGKPRTSAAVVVALVIVLGIPAGAASVAPVRDGDLIFQTSKSAQSIAIQRATHSPFSHMGMIVHRQGGPFVFEAGGTVEYTPLDAWIASGSGGTYVVKRLRDADARWTAAALERMRNVLRGLEGRPYDTLFEWSDQRMYCSELIWKVYDRVLQVQIGELQQLREFDLGDPEVQRQMRERYGDNVPLEEPVISPAAMYASPLLEVVQDTSVRETVIGLPCEGCEAVFDGIPDALSSQTRIAPANEPGQPLRIEGTVLDAQGRPAPGVIVYAYHTDARGIYPANERAATVYGRRHGRLRGWVKTDAQGRYRFDTIRPASYPNSDIPQHVHMHVIEVGCCTYWIEDVLFDDDPFLTTERRESSGPGGNGVGALRRDGAGWVVVRDIVLGQGVPRYTETQLGPDR